VIVVTETDRWTVNWGLPTVAPSRKCHKDRGEFEARLRKCVFDPTRMIAISIRAYHPALDQRGQPISQHVPTNAEIFNQLIEPMNADEKVTHDERRPPVTDGFKRTR
jgi:hypothetical protein